MSEPDLNCVRGDDGSYELAWKNGYSITALPNGQVCITKSPFSKDFRPTVCGVWQLIPADSAARIADAFAAGQQRMIDEEGPDEACRGGKEVAEFIANAIRRQALLTMLA